MADLPSRAMTCAFCPYCAATGLNSFGCRKDREYLRRIDDPYKTPDWCPLQENENG